MVLRKRVAVVTVATSVVFGAAIAQQPRPPPRAAVISALGQKATCASFGT